ncbi:MAG TPA: 4Fe-4S dicluster domain-containing protein [Candidatus Omnitrophica bacterium]|nr:4Fe-4S dicluster domain-containing protein [Candidatus Omnitrophota bacterium]
MVSKRIVLHFPQNLVDKPIICKLAKDYNLEFNILKASVTPKEEGLLVLELSGEEKKYNQGIDYLKNVGVKVQLLRQDVVRDEERCVHCGVCVPLCPGGALVIEESSRKVEFFQDKCIACELCVKICPHKAMTVKF